MPPPDPVGLAPTPPTKSPTATPPRCGNGCPRHIQILVGMAPESKEEPAQKYYSRGFKETRQQLIERLLDPTMTLEDTARVLGVCPTTVRRYTNRGILPHYRTLGQQRRFRLSDVLAFLEKQQKQALKRRKMLFGDKAINMVERYDFSNVAPRLHQNAWGAKWAMHPDALLRIGDTGAVFLFRKAIVLNAVPERFVVHVSADQRYRLFVNGKSVAFGPARGDLLHWNYETLDLAPFLRVGENVFSARVHFFVGENAPVAQITSGYPAFLMQGNTDAETGADTPDGWRVCVDGAYTFTNEPAQKLWTYAVVGASEIFDAAKHPHGWRESGFDDAAWLPAKAAKKAAPHGTSDAETHWWLVPRGIPLMTEETMLISTVRRGSPNIEPRQPFTIPANTTATWLLDHGANTCAFLAVIVSGGAGSTITASYAEGLQDANAQPNLHAKGNRNDIDGKELRGYTDTWHPAGGDAVQTLDTLHWRTFRYTELTAATADEPLIIHALGASATGYPWERKAQFDAPEMPVLAEIREVGWRTLRLCSHETFMDCPYYEQLQYAGDTRIQALATLYETGDPRLFRNSLLQFDDSRAAFGLTMSRYPSRIPQVISPFSLWWVCMVEDYYRHVPGSENFVRGLLPGVRSVVDWFMEHLRADNLLGELPHWSFVDWCRGGGWEGGCPPGTRTESGGGSAIASLQFVLALQSASRLFAECGYEKATGERFAKLADTVFDAVKKTCYDADTHRIADTPRRETVSQHGNILAVLAGVADAPALMHRVLTDSDMTPATYYFRFYLNCALRRAGMGGELLANLQPWRDMLALGLTTWAEEPEPTRSDCHAWSASPNYEFLVTVLGVEPEGAGWAQTRIAPHLGDLTNVSGAVPISGGGIVSVRYTRTGNVLRAEIELPASGAGSAGTLHWRGETAALVAGAQVVVIGR